MHPVYGGILLVSSPIYGGTTLGDAKRQPWARQARSHECVAIETAS